jgi:hypothetical protein
MVPRGDLYPLFVVNRPPAVWDRSMRMCGDGYVGAFPLFITNMRSRHCIVGGDRTRMGGGGTEKMCTLHAGGMWWFWY